MINDSVYYNTLYLFKFYPLFLSNIPHICLNIALWALISVLPFLMWTGYLPENETLKSPRSWAGSTGRWKSGIRLLWRHLNIRSVYLLHGYFPALSLEPFQFCNMNQLRPGGGGQMWLSFFLCLLKLAIPTILLHRLCLSPPLVLYCILLRVVDGSSR